jgi:hypothetical protein
MTAALSMTCCARQRVEAKARKEAARELRRFSDIRDLRTAFAGAKVVWRSVARDVAGCGDFF